MASAGSGLRSCEHRKRFSEEPNGNLCRLCGRAIGDRSVRETKLEPFVGQKDVFSANRAGFHAPASPTVVWNRLLDGAPNEPSGKL
jgi:hypothetical protein